MMTAQALPARGLLAFGALSVLDFVLTRHLLLHGEGVYEANPLASWFLRSFDWAGLAGFKALAALSAIGLVLGVHALRPRAGRRVLAFGCAALGGVVIYSGMLAYNERARAAEVDRIIAETDQLDDTLDKGSSYRRTLIRLRAELLEGRVTLASAAEQLAATDKGQDVHWLRAVRRLFPGLTNRQALAASLVQFTIGTDTNVPGAADHGRRLLNELYEYCQTDSAETFHYLICLVRHVESLDASAEAQ